MSDFVSPPSNVVILFDPSNRHVTLDEDDYPIFHRCITFGEILQLINTRQYGHIDLHVPTNFTFDDMQTYPRVYIHTYFMDDEELSDIDGIEREKVRDSIRTCCGYAGVEYVERGVMDGNPHDFDESISYAERMYQMDINRRDRTLQ